MKMTGLSDTLCSVQLQRARASSLVKASARDSTARRRIASSLLTIFLRTYREHNIPSLPIPSAVMTRRGGREDRRRDRRTGPSPFGADAVRAASAEVPADIGQARHRLVERREAQRFGGKASHAFRSPHARASGRVSQTRPNGSRKPIQARLRRQSGTKAPAANEGPRKPLAPPGAPFPFGETEKRERRCPRRDKQQGGGALAPRWSFRPSATRESRNP